MPTRNKHLADIVIASGGTVTSRSMNGLLQDWLDAIGGQSIQPFEVDKIVFIGASITDQSIAPQSTRSMLESYVLNKYGKQIEILERATAGYGVDQLRATIDDILTEFTSEANTHFVLHTLGNDISFGTEYLSLPEVKKTQLHDDLAYVYDAIHAAGHKVIQSSLTHRNYSGVTIDNDPSTKVTELLGSYTYTRDLIVPMMLDKCPEFVSNGWPIIDAYNATRDIYEDWKDGEDVVHPNKWARIVFGMTLVDGMMMASLGLTPQPNHGRNFNDTPPLIAGVDTTFGTGLDTTIGTTDDNINWLIRSQYPANDPTYASLQGSVNGSGNQSGLSIYTYFGSGWNGVGGNVTNPSDSSSSLSNDVLLSSYCSSNASAGAIIYAVIEGLTPYCEYEVSTVTAIGHGAEELNRVYIHNGVGDQIDVRTDNPENNVLTKNVVSDYMGRIFVAVEEESASNWAVLNGIRIS